MTDPNQCYHPLIAQLTVNTTMSHLKVPQSFYGVFIKVGEILCLFTVTFKNDSNPLCRDQLNFLNLMWHDFEWHFSHFNPYIIVLCISIKSTYAKRKNITQGAIINTYASNSSCAFIQGEEL